MAPEPLDYPPLTLAIGRLYCCGMNQSTVASVVGGVSSLFVLLGITGITGQDLTGFINVVVALVAFGSYIWAHVAHKKEVAAASAGPYA